MYTRIMVAMDGSTSSRRALEEGLKMAGLCHARVSAVYVVDKSAVFTYPGRLDPNALIEADRRAGVAVLHDAERTIARAAVNGETELVETECLGEDIAERLQRYVDDHAIDLAVVGTHGRRGVRRMVIGSVAERFLRESRCPVLLMRGDDAPPAAVAAA
ncbi:universal stress protein [Burkholderia stagnalis]|uniref:Universal stress protein n=1 Tax=Burkholderia stagnalis TaxID=1503054 RepID=A0ABX9YF45_9BURK|nr:universal stress protein [Burkholderia stagnalis]KVN18672.1 universal stress protein UspA [Burkholderia stagnalis]KVN64752.1 universal stress protein UspA [Burkholderia stagnalis]KWK53871.1 universal stress protein UspA [Burkholderia stagnalis]KWK56345.1 universal stress protein UspA [Burkholderia stagnalis]KWN70145.1 universal stress protein UspA [Burkholderia stagnalis]